MTNPAPSWDLFDPPPRIKISAPSAPGSKTSEDSADAIEPFRRKSWRRILYTLASIPESACLSREEICERIGMRESSACARLFELAPTWIEVLDGARTSSAGMRVNGYQLTTKGRDLFKQKPQPKREDAAA